MNNNISLLSEIKKIRFTKEQVLQIQQTANSINKDFGPTVRLLCLNSKLTIISKSDKETTVALLKIGINLNQVVKKINQLDSFNVLSKELNQILNHINEIQTVIKKLNDSEN